MNVPPESAVRLGGIAVKSHVPGRLRLRLPILGQAAIVRSLNACRELGLVTSLVFNERAGSALLRYDPQAYSKHELLACLLNVCETGSTAGAAALQDSLARSGHLPAEVISWPGFSVRCDLPGRLRLRHPLLRWSQAVQQSMAAGLMSLEGVRRYRVTPDTASVLVDYSPDRLSRQDLRQALIRFVEQGLSESPEGVAGLQPAPIKLSRPVLQLSFATVTLGVAVAAWSWPALGTIALAGTFTAALHTLAEGVINLVRRRRPTVDTLDATTIAIGLYFRYTLPVATMIWLLNLSELLLDATFRSSRELVTGFFGNANQSAWVLIDGALEKRSISALNVGDIVVVLSGEQVPVDGVIVEGEGMLDQSVLTGEYAPVERGEGEEVFARTGVIAGSLHIRVVRSGQDTYAAGIVRILEQSIEHRVRLQTMCEEFADYMVIPTYALGAGAQAIAGSNAMLAVLNADFGTGIRIAGPAAMLSSIGAAIEHGILIKDGGVLERLHQVDAIVFDKTGTLTEAVPAVRQVVSFERGWDQDQLLSHIASAEQRFHHPIARAILREAEARGLAPSPLIHSDYQAGLGIEVDIGNGILRVGSRRYMENLGLPLGASEQRLVEEIDGRGGSCIFAALDERIMGLVELEAEARPEASRIIENLRKKRGLREIHLLSGDHEAATAQVAAQLGIDTYRAGVLPADKVEFVRALQDRGLRVAMVGDGVNDSAALSQADCGISLRGGADAAIDAADIVFMDGRLRNLELLFHISENLRDNVRTSFRLLVFCNSFLIAGALLGRFGLASSVIINNALNLMAAINGLRAPKGLALESPSRAFLAPDQRERGETARP